MYKTLLALTILIAVLAPAQNKSAKKTSAAAPKAEATSREDEASPEEIATMESEEAEDA